MTAWSDTPLTDPEVAAELAEVLDPQDFANILVAFAADIRLRTRHLRQALDSADVAAARVAVHSLKGAALNLGHNRLGGLCAHLQHADLPELHALWPDFLGVCDASLAALGDTGLAFEGDSSIVRL